jgi:hypothetical protein
MNKETKQTAVDWLIEQLRKPTANYIPIFEIINKAKEIENAKAFEIFKAGQDSMKEGGKGFDQYYKDTFE